ncbi:glutathione stransferase [Acanthamoeba castellanii str. Neff]|uniref:Glutathione stransferase n=2 Tax=Acanthamoeba castellanii (strain ATCC 30010 / Neff) TaxID=1257118 RepID=L8GWF0_ACACF|nr:glutathione stransferase [Acanthamoeba castellanii str. Neff]ELR16918.1 glutathione stransferase [Acanthamoeba castellanii str. Neff]
MSTSTVTKPTLTYFHLLGRAELPRALLEDAGVDYDFVAVTNWPESKAQLIAEGKLAFGQLPLYEEPGLTLVQTTAIARYLARKHGYNGTNAHEEALIDQASEGVGDVLTSLVKTLFFTPAEQLAEAKEKLVKETLPGQLANFEKLLEKNGNSGYLVGSKLSYADLSLWAVVRLLVSRIEGTSEESLLGSFPAVKKLFTTVSERERLKAYVARDVYAKQQ